MRQLSYRLPGGYVDAAGLVHRDGELVPLSGREEELLANSHAPSSAALVTSILSRCVRRLGTISPVPEDVARGLLVADRQYLLLRLREVTFGSQVRSSIVCPWPDCRQRIDVSFPLDAIPVRESTDHGPIYTLMLSPEAAMVDAQGEHHREVAFRLPTGADQEALSAMVLDNAAQALTLLLQRCIQRIGPFEEPGAELVGRLSPLARMEIEQHMEAVAPQLDLTMESTCPECNREYVEAFDLQEFFFGELRINHDVLYREIHYLAYHYHWSEREIVELPREKRRKYIEVLAEEIERLNDAI